MCVCIYIKATNKRDYSTRIMEATTKIKANMDDLTMLIKLSNKNGKATKHHKMLHDNHRNNQIKNENKSNPSFSS